MFRTLSSHSHGGARSSLSVVKISQMVSWIKTWIITIDKLNLDQWSNRSNVMQMVWTSFWTTTMMKVWCYPILMLGRLMTNWFIKKFKWSLMRNLWGWNIDYVINADNLVIWLKSALKVHPLKVKLIMRINIINNVEKSMRKEKTNSLKHWIPTDLTLPNLSRYNRTNRTSSAPFRNNSNSAYKDYIKTVQSCKRIMTWSLSPITLQLMILKLSLYGMKSSLNSSLRLISTIGMLTLSFSL